MFGKFFGRKPHKAAEPAADKVSEQVTDAIAAANMAVLGSSAAVSVDQAILALSQSHGVLFANMLSEQQQFTAAGQVAALQTVAQIFGLDHEGKRGA